jgi:hypothetical protein
MRRFVLYSFILTIFGLGILLTLEHGRKLEAPQTVGPSLRSTATSADSIAEVGPSASLLQNLRENLQDPLTRLFVQLILIIMVARWCGALTMTIRQPAVVGEMIAGILLGPSLLGWLWPDFFHFVFAASSLGSLRLFSQIGVCLFMFVVGMELDVSQLKQQARTAVLVSQTSILLPFLLGMVSSLFLFPRFAGSATTFPAFSLFVGISMSITAFPVLARILEERGLTQSPLGVTALICAASGLLLVCTVELLSFGFVFGVAGVPRVRRRFALALAHECHAGIARRGVLRRPAHRSGPGDRSGFDSTDRNPSDDDGLATGIFRQKPARN